MKILSVGVSPSQLRNADAVSLAAARTQLDEWRQDEVHFGGHGRKTAVALLAGGAMALAQATGVRANDIFLPFAAKGEMPSGQVATAPPPSATKTPPPPSPTNPPPPSPTNQPDPPTATPTTAPPSATPTATVAAAELPDQVPQPSQVEVVSEKTAEGVLTGNTLAKLTFSSKWAPVSEWGVLDLTKVSMTGTISKFRGLTRPITLTPEGVSVEGHTLTFTMPGPVPERAAFTFDSNAFAQVASGGTIGLAAGVGMDPALAALVYNKSYQPLSDLTLSGLIAYNTGRGRSISTVTEQNIRDILDSVAQAAGIDFKASGEQKKIENLVGNLGLRKASDKTDLTNAILSTYGTWMYPWLQEVLVWGDTDPGEGVAGTQSSPGPEPRVIVEVIDSDKDYEKDPISVDWMATQGKFRVRYNRAALGDGRETPQTLASYLVGALALGLQPEMQDNSLSLQDRAVIRLLQSLAYQELMRTQGEGIIDNGHPRRIDDFFGRSDDLELILQAWINGGQHQHTGGIGPNPKMRPLFPETPVRRYVGMTDVRQVLQERAAFEHPNTPEGLSREVSPVLKRALERMTGVNAEGLVTTEEAMVFLSRNLVMNPVHVLEMLDWFGYVGSFDGNNQVWEEPTRAVVGNDSNREAWQSENPFKAKADRKAQRGRR